MAYLPELHYCCVCRRDLGPDNGDGICFECERLPIRCGKCGRFTGDAPCGRCEVNIDEAVRLAEGMMKWPDLFPEYHPDMRTLARAVLAMRDRMLSASQVESFDGYEVVPGLAVWECPACGWKGFQSKNKTHWKCVNCGHKQPATAEGKA